MDIREIYFSKHAIQRMFERSISRDAIIQILGSGEVVSEYPKDTPFPSLLLLGWMGNRPLHVVAAVDEKQGICVVVTAYIPDLGEWEEDYKTRRRQL